VKDANGQQFAYLYCKDEPTSALGALFDRKARTPSGA
jgi:hypothetical protein